MKRLLPALLIGLLAALLTVAMDRFHALDRAEFITWGWRVKAMQKPGPATGRIKLVLIDQYSLDAARRSENRLSWPWPREAYRAILDFCRRGGAKAVAFDMIFTEPSYMGVADDQALGAAIASMGSFAGTVFLGNDPAELRAWPAGIPAPARPLAGLADWLRMSGSTSAVAATASFPVPEVATNVAWLGNVSEAPDADGTFRRVAMFRSFDGRGVPALGLAAWLAGAGADEDESALRLDGDVLHAGRLAAPVDRDGRAILRFRGPSQTHQAFNAWAVINSELRLEENPTNRPPVDPAVFKDCYVFLGASAPGLMDLRTTPAGRVYPGVEIHATALDNLLSGDFLRPAPAGWMTGLAVLLALFFAGLVRASGSATRIALSLTAAVVVPVAAGFAAYAAGWWYPVVPHALAALLAGAGTALYNYSTEGRQKAFIRHAFQHYLGPQVIEQILADPSRLRLGGERRVLTMYFSDIEKFSSFSEKLDPPTLTALLNEFLSEMSAIIKEEGGYLDKYIGDAIVAFWNAPIEQPDHAARAVRAALRCQERLDARRAELQAKYNAVVRMRIGLNTGEVVVGNMGSAERMNYTILGDAANLASRLEGANKAFGTFLMVSETTWDACGGAFAGRELARLRVVGRSAAVRVYEAWRTPPPGAETFAAALRLYQAGRFAEARAEFGRLPDDPAARAYAARCAALEAEPPAEWDGVWNLMEK